VTIPILIKIILKKSSKADEDFKKDHLKKAAAGRLPAGDQKTWGW
jgi:hypothetical protein